MGYYLISEDVDKAIVDYKNYSEADFVCALEQFTKSDVYFDRNKIAAVFVERFKDTLEIEKLVEAATKRKIADHPTLMAIPGYKRMRLSQDLSM